MRRLRIEEPDGASCSILVVSCDGYRDLWIPFFTLFHQYWPDCQMPVYLGTDGNPSRNADSSVDAANTSVCPTQVLRAGNDKEWSGRLRVFLQSIETEYVLLLLEDFFLDRPVSSAAVRKEIDLLHALHGVSMRLFPNPPADYFRDGVGVIHVRAPFRVSLQAAVWNRVRLLELLVDEESCWEFETAGSRRSQTWASGFYCVPQPVIHYRHVVERGEWFRAQARSYAECGIGCDFQARPVMGFLKTCKKRPLNLLRRALNRIHSRWLCLRYPESLSDAG